MELGNFAEFVGISPESGSTSVRFRTDGPSGPEFSERILPVDAPVALRCARLHVPDPRSDRDSFIAATALVHGMTVVTRNVADFVPTQVAIVNPWEAAE